MPVVLWVSKHTPVRIQEDVLKQKLGKDTVIVVESREFANAEEVMNLAREYKADFIVPVLPMSFIMRLVELAEREGITVLYSEMELIRTEYSQPIAVDPYSEVVVPARDERGRRCYKVFRFKCFKRIKEIKLVLEDF